MKSKIAKHFIKMGITALITTIPFVSFASDFKTSKYQEDMRQTVKILQKKGYIEPRINVFIKENKSIGDRYDIFVPAENYSAILNKNSCDVTITLSKTGDRAYLSQRNDIKDLTSPKNENQKKISREFMLLHEVSHCQFETFNDVFLIKNNPQLQKEVNFYFKHAEGSSSSASPYLLLNENFSDTYAAIQLLKIYGDTKDVKHVINQISLERQDDDLLRPSIEPIDSHYTHFSLLEVLKEESINKIKSISQPEELMRFALEIANKGTFTVLSTYQDSLDSLFEKESMLESTLMNVHNNSIINFLASNDFKNKSKLIKENITELTFFQQLGNEVIQKVKLKRKYDNKKQIAPLSETEIIQLTELSEIVLLAKYEDAFKKIDSVSSDFKKYILSEHEPVLNQKISSATTKQEMIEKRIGMLNEYKIRSFEIEKIIDSTNKLDILEKIKDLRPRLIKTINYNPN